MLSLLERHAIQVLLAAGHSQEDVARQREVSVRTVRRVDKEALVTAASVQHEVRTGRPSTVAAWTEVVQAILDADPGVMTLEILRRLKLQGYTGGKSALYELVASLRPEGIDLQTRFEGLPGEFSQHDFGQVDVRYVDGRTERIHFFGSRLKWSRLVAVTIVPNEQAETLVRTLLDHFEFFGGVPLCAVFDRPKTVILSWAANGVAREWNPVFALAATEIGFVPEVCWPHAPQQKGAVESLVKWVKGSFFKQRRFLDRADLEQQLAAWLVEVNDQRPSRATGIVPRVRWAQERDRLRPPRIAPDDLALRLPIVVGPTGYVVFAKDRYSVPPEAAGLSGTLYLHKDRVRIVAGRHETVHVRGPGTGKAITHGDHRAQQVASLSGQRGRRYLKRQHLLDTGEAAEQVLTEIVHHKPFGWNQDVDRLHDLLQRHGADALNRALRAAVDLGRFDVETVERFFRPNLFQGDVRD
jgi:transposase